MVPNMFSSVFTFLPTLSISLISLGMIVSQDFKVDRSTFEEGKRQFEVIKHNADLPNYGQCWKDVVFFTQTGCQRLTDEMQGRLALAYLNCFLELQGRQKYDCDQTQSLEECTREMHDADRGSFTTFFTHTQNICYFLRAQVWNEVTENTISALAQSSSQVASQLQESSQLQAEMMKQQNESLHNQKILIENAANLTSVLSSSSEEVNRLFHTFKETTQEQRLLITDVFEQLTSLKQTVLGEFSGFYSILYYFFSVLVCYLLTSTTRTHGARFWMFSVVTSSVFCEYLITSWAPPLLMWRAVELTEHDDWVYWLRNFSRKIFALFGALVLGLSAYYYRDINTANNQLLMEIKKQNSDLRRLLSGAQISAKDVSEDDPFAVGGVRADDDNTTTEDAESESETHSFDSESDRTYILEENTPSVSDTDSYMTAETLHGSSLPSSASRNDSLLQELKDLRSVTPLKEMAGQIDRWISTGVYSRQHSVTAAVSNGSPSVNVSFGGSPYMLRPRCGRTSGFTPPAAEVESPQSFAKTVRQLERIAEKNSKMVCAAVARKRPR